VSNADREPARRSVDVGATHLALVVSDLERSIAFYARYAGMQVVHRRHDPGGRVVWLSDLTRPFVLVLIEGEVEARLAGAARAEGCLALGPTDSGPPIGYWAFLRDPDGHHLELSFGQEVGLTVAAAARGGGG
jgi:catechol 2,3-dioxygenase-like lactoylglutathione lyase family enzyme